MLKSSLKLSKVMTLFLVLAGLFVVLKTPAFADPPKGSDTTEARESDAIPVVAPDGLDRGEQIRAVVEKFQDRVRRKIEALDKSFQELDLRKIEVQQLSRERFEEILDDLDQETGLILRSFSDVRPDVKQLRLSLEKAPGIFLQIASEFEEKATTTEDDFFREAYVELAAASRKMAANCEQKSKAMDALERELQSKLRFVQTSQEFCQNIRRFLRTLPTEPGIATEKWIERVNQYVNTLEQTVRLLKKMSDGIDQKPTADPKPTPKATSASVTERKRPMTLAEAKARLASLKP